MPTDLENVPAVVLAGGKGTRLRPFTVTFPKPLVPLGERPILDHLLSQLEAQGVVDVTLSLGHLSGLIRSYINSHPDLTARLNIRFVEEEKPLGTAGCLSLVADFDRTFLVLNGDLLTDIDFSLLLDAHRRSGAAVTIGTYVRRHEIDFGVLDISDQCFVEGYREKPSHTYSVSMGVYVYEPHVLKYIRGDEYLDFPTLILDLLDNGEKVYSYKHQGFWLDIGRPEDYAKAQAYVEDSSVQDGARPRRT